MADPIQEWKVETWRQNVFHLAQQEMQKLQGTVATANGEPSKRIGMDRLAPMRGERGRPSRFAPTPNIGSDETRRWINPEFWSFGKVVDRWDQLETIHMLTNQYSRAGASDMARFHDEKIIGTFDPAFTAFTQIVGGALGTVDEGEETTAAVIFDVTNQLIAASAAGMTRSKITQAHVKFLENDYDPARHGPRTMVYSPQALITLLADDSLVQLEFVQVRGLMEGRPAPGLMGFDNWIPSTLLPKVGDIRRCVAYALEAVVLGMWDGGFARASEREDLRYRPQIYMEEMRNAARLEDKYVVAIDIDEAVIPA